MHPQSAYERLVSLDRPFGGGSLALRLGRRIVELAGLDEALASLLRLRWNGFLSSGSAQPADYRIEFFRAGPAGWLDPPAPGEHYRIEAPEDEPQRVVLSYHFAVAADHGPTSWRTGISDDPQEPLGRIIENAVRFVAAHMALDDGGFAMHAAGVLFDGRGHLLAGESRAGKSTASRQVRDGVSLGDDFGMVVRGETGWECPALPFDNSEHVEGRPCSGTFPVAGIWRLYQSDVTRVEPAGGLRGVSSLVACAAFPWTMSERADGLLAHVESFVEQGLFHHLYFARNAELQSHLAAATPDAD